ncbi:Glycosyltransferase like family 2 [uncultured archaeon]|nr:Glycosyltransferase like family 2 [uncultured archaeon]
MKLSILITAFKEEKTIGKAIESFLNQNIKESFELIVMAPDKETLLEAKKYPSKNKIKLVKDPGKGKSYAINKILPKIKSEIILLTDGDVYVSENSVNEILEKFKDKKVGCVTGRPFPSEDKSKKYGYWANFLFDSAHEMRMKLKKDNKFLECSGYLWAFRNGIIKEFPLDVAEDTIVPYLFSEKGYKIDYAENALVYVKNVNNWKDWISQKIRTSRAHETLNKYVNTKKFPRSKTFSNEARGAFSLFIYPRSIMQFLWSIELFLARFYMWIKVFNEVYIRKKYHQDGWQRVESTK